MSADLSATELAAGYTAGEFGPLEVTRAALDRVAQFNGRVNALVHVDADAALASAAESEQRWRAGTPLSPLDGVPVTIKDILMVRGWHTGRGSLLTKGAPPAAQDSPAAARLRESGAVLLGANTTPEFGWKGVTDSPAFGPTGNPWGEHLTAGGSSGGSAAAVGLGMGPVSIGTDGGGSVRIPASFTGTLAFKPTFGRIPAYPPSPYGTLAHLGPMARTVTDLATVLDVLAATDHRDPLALPPPTSSYTEGLDRGVNGLRVGLHLGESDDPEVTRAVGEAALVFEQAGAVVSEAELPFADPREVFHALWFAGAAKVVDSYAPDAAKRGLVDPELLAAIEEFGHMDASAYLDAMTARTELGVRMGEFHQTYDLLLTPTMPIAAFDAGRDAPVGWDGRWWTTWSPYTYPFNLTMQPAISVPCGFTDDHRPIGLQIVGPRHADRLVLAAGQVYTSRTSWAAQRPPMLTDVNLERS